MKFKAHHIRRYFARYIRLNCGENKLNVLAVRISSDIEYELAASTKYYVLITRRGQNYFDVI